MRALLLLIADRARDAGMILLCAAGLAEVMAWVYDSGHADALRDRLEASE